MTETIDLGEISVQVTRKNVKNAHLTVHPPDGRVTLVTPLDTKLEVARAFAITKLSWIREQKTLLSNQARETPRQFVTRESHYVWGRRYLLEVKYVDARPAVHLDHKRILLSVRPGSDQSKRAEVIHEWHKALLHEVVPSMIKDWEPRLGVKVSGYFLQRMKTKWGSCNRDKGNIRLNTELVKKPRDLLEYVVVHEMIHLIEPTHNDRFIGLLDEHFPGWRESRTELNELPISS